MFSTSLQTRSSRPGLTPTGSSSASTVRSLVDDVGAPWSPDVPSLAYSCSKTFTSAAVGIAVERGAFGYDDTLAQLWPQACTANTGPIARSITVRNALSMSTGHSAEQLLEPTLASRRPPDLNTAQTLSLIHI